jgi:hypothetical protein
MTTFVVIVVIGALIGLFALRHKSVSTKQHNDAMLAIYNAVYARLSAALMNDEITFADFIEAINLTRDIYNSSLRGSKKKREKLILPHAKVISTGENYDKAKTTLETRTRSFRE